VDAGAIVFFALNYVTRNGWCLIMTFDAQAIFANLTEKERLYGHHSAEGRAMRVLGRALNGWTTHSLAAFDVLALCEQAVGDWLKARLKVSQWSAQSVTRLLTSAVTQEIVTKLEAVQLRRLHHRRADAAANSLVAAQVENALEACIRIIEKRWQ
jgi:chorismate mutase